MDLIIKAANFHCGFVGRVGLEPTRLFTGGF